MKVYASIDIAMDDVPIIEFKDNYMGIINDLIENGTNNGYYAQCMKVDIEDVRINSIKFEEEE